MKKAALIGLRVVGAVVALVALVVGVTFVTLRTNWGGERLRRQVVSRVNQQIQGHLDIGRLSFGGDRIAVWGVTLRDPDGREVATVAHTEVAFAIMRLLRKEVRVTAVAIDAPHLALVSGDRGSNLARATAPRKKAAPKPPAKPRTTEEGWVVRLDRFDLNGGDVTVATEGDAATADTRAHLAALQSSMKARYATGNGSLDLAFRLDGRSLLAPVGPMHLSIDALSRGNTYRFGVEGALLGGTIKARGNVDSAHLENADALVAIAIPAQKLGGHDWGPLRVDGQAHPGSVPKLDLLLAIPGLAVTGHGGAAAGAVAQPGVQPGAQPEFAFDGRVALNDLGLTARAMQALAGGAQAPALAGNGRIDFGFGGPMVGAPASFSAQTRGLFERIRSGETVVEGLTIEGRTAHLSSHPGQADLNVAIKSVNAGATALGGVTLQAKARAQTISAELAIASPRPVSLTLAATMDSDRQSLALERLALIYPGGRWATEGIARLDFGGDRVALSSFRMLSEGQTVAIDGSKTAEEVQAHLTIRDVRLGLLPTFLVDPQLRLGGLLDADVKADGELANPTVVASLQLQDGRYQGFSKIAAKVKATLADQKADGTIDVSAPFVAANAAFKIPVDPLVPGAPLDLRLEVTRLHLAEALRSAGMAAQADGRVNLKLQVTGSANDPKVDLTVTGKDLKVARPAASASARAPAAEVADVDVGHGRVALTYADRKARADIDFASAHGGTLRVDAAAHVDLSYPRVTQGIVARKLPVHGKVVARDLEVAWIAQFNPRVESLGGQVNADAKLAGTVGDPQFVGDVRWKNGKIVATAPEKPPTRR